MSIGWALCRIFTIDWFSKIHLGWRYLSNLNPTWFKATVQQTGWFFLREHVHAIEAWYSSSRGPSYKWRTDMRQSCMWKMLGKNETMSRRTTYCTSISPTWMTNYNLITTKSWAFLSLFMVYLYIPHAWGHCSPQNRSEDHIDRGGYEKLESVSIFWQHSTSK